MLSSFGVITPDQQASIDTIINLTRDFLAYLLPILPVITGVVLVLALLYKFTLGAVKRI